MGFSVTPKAHLLFVHLIAQMIKFGGIGDKTEDFCERSHQEQARYSRITHRMPVGKGMVLDMRMDWRRNNPVIKKQIFQVRKQCSRKKSKKETNEEAYKRKLTTMRNVVNKKRKLKGKRCQRMVVKLENAESMATEE